MNKEIVKYHPDEIRRPGWYEILSHLKNNRAIKSSNLGMVSGVCRVVEEDGELSVCLRGGVGKIPLRDCGDTIRFEDTESREETGFFLCPSCFSREIKTEVNIGFEVTEAGEMHQHLDRCERCGLWRPHNDLISFDGKLTKMFGNWKNKKKEV